MNKYTNEFQSVLCPGMERGAASHLSWLNGNVLPQSRGQRKASLTQGMFCITVREQGLCLGSGGLGTRPKMLGPCEMLGERH